MMHGRRASSYGERPSLRNRHRGGVQIILPTDGLCIYWNCYDPVSERKLCMRHYQELKRDEGKVLTHGRGRKTPEAKCLTENCKDSGVWCGLCKRCYDRAYKRSK